MTKDEEIKISKAVQQLIESHSGEVTYDLVKTTSKDWLNRVTGRKTTLTVVFYENEPQKTVSGVKIVNGKKPKEMDKQQMSLNLL